MKEDPGLVESLNSMLAQEQACAIRYATHAAVLAGPYSETVAARLKEIGADEMRHAEMLRDRILALGGEPTMAVNEEDLRPASRLEDILAVNIEEEQRAIERYVRVLEATSPTNVILYQTLQEIVRDEQEHLEELEQLQTPRGRS